MFPISEAPFVNISSAGRGGWSANLHCSRSHCVVVDLRRTSSHSGNLKTAGQPVRTKGGKRVLHVTVDHFSKWKWATPLISKRDAPADLAKIFRSNKLKPKVVRTDKGGEYCAPDGTSNAAMVTKRTMTLHAGRCEHKHLHDMCHRLAMAPVRVKRKTSCLGSG